MKTSIIILLMLFIAGCSKVIDTDDINSVVFVPYLYSGFTGDTIIITTKKGRTVRYPANGTLYFSGQKVDIVHTVFNGTVMIPNKGNK